MTKPTKEELEIALKEAAYMKEHDADPKFIAKALLNLNYRVNYLYEVFKTAEKYLYFGQEENEHQALTKAIEKARHEERNIEKKEDPPTYGL
ncbi:hypothetical protein [Aliikangiella sp. G2MR2-5]|uniref:hypothetical protein n=1 Tax=Aliikangiella sp. G2MR2-5 TaxID=2788943 RepID=UPI0018AB2806|nr:hypothetical protein [Aliikangiella sp. G2MR2-5]